MMRLRFAFDLAHRLTGAPFGVLPERCWVDVGDETFAVFFGALRVEGSLRDIREVALGGPNRFPRGAVPPRRRRGDGALLLVSSGAAGVEVGFNGALKVSGLRGGARVCGLVMTVEDVPAAIGAFGAGVGR